MKRKTFERPLAAHGCALHHHGGSHDVWLNGKSLAMSAIPRHDELKFGLVRAVCKQLGVPVPDGKEEGVAKSSPAAVADAGHLAA